MIEMEVCANSVTSAIEAQLGGAKRVELCASLTEGGTTPSYSEIVMSKKMLDIEVYPIIRPRGGDFLYSALEFELMKEDVRLCKSLGCEGISTGILTSDGKVDKIRCAELFELASPMKVTFHRAFDMTDNLEEALEDIIALGAVRILTSGGKSSALEGAAVLSKLIEQADGRISIMPGAGVNINNLAEIISITGAKEFHASARLVVSSDMTYRNDALNMGADADEYSTTLTNAGLVKKLLELANSAE
ncbi:copper homeostasis protein CutC [Pedobacter sp. MC2016-15]|uniref:copper homeostasis protein CutC n=1 Tax=Pedobacter sp. MC2016-15 TaxID=2994473 RepID=UPI002247ACC2|nr:copper homeostasis protein CutC [Pedobacter sp. MC2016-15]MCX2477573.1 copper homeostasis protein CutC [Pedobacter sp. MC2016-15]